MATTKVKLLIAREVLSNGLKIKDAALKWCVSTTTVRNYMDLYTEGKLKLDVIEELDAIRLHVMCAKNDDKDTLTRRMKQVNDDLMLLKTQLSEVA